MFLSPGAELDLDDVLESGLLDSFLVVRSEPGEAK